MKGDVGPHQRRSRPSPDLENRLGPFNVNNYVVCRHVFGPAGCADFQVLAELDD